MRQKIFAILRFIHVVIDRGAVSLLSLRLRQHYIRFSYRIKIYLFPEYGGYVPEAQAVSSGINNALFPPPIPNWLLQEMKDLGRNIDPVLYPTDAFVAGCQYYTFPIIPMPGRIYKEIIQNCTVSNYTHCFAIPWLKPGGADLVSLRHIKFASRQPGAKVLVILTEIGHSPWVNLLPKEVDIFKLSDYINKISNEELLQLIARLLAQLQINTLHIINSRHVWEVVRKYGRAISQRTKIFASLYCDDYDRYGRPVGYAREYLCECYPYLKKIFSDNEAFPKLLRETYGYSKDLFQVLKNPAEIRTLDKPRAPLNNSVLWASRLDRQKRPDLLVLIAQSMPHVEFHVYGETLIEGKKSDTYCLKNLKNVFLKGKFSGADTLPFEDFSVFLFTSQWEGMPNILLAAAAAAIPIVASSVGGVGEVINRNTGFPVFDIEDIEEYKKNIQFVLDNPLEAQARADLAKEYIEKEHTQAKFESMLLNTTNYW